MAAYYQDNIVAIATAPQNGAIGIVRISGPDAKNILKDIFRLAHKNKSLNFKPRFMYFGHIADKDGILLDQAMAVFMPGPSSFTGEDVVELHCHGNLILLKRVVQLVLSLEGQYEIRGAQHGEFSKRAFLNGKLDLTQAESIHQIITADSDAALKLSLSNLDGKLKNVIQEMTEKLKISLALIEASFEFPEEDIQTYDHKKVMELVVDTLNRLQELDAAFATSKLFDHGVSVAIVGRPNVGKSSLLNAILVEDRAIVTDVAGTTRDVIEGAKVIDGVRFVFRDTAGIRTTKDKIEAVGIDKSQTWIEKSDVVLHVIDDLKVVDELDAIKDKEVIKNRCLRIINKADVLFSLDELSGEGSRMGQILSDHRAHALISAKTGFGLNRLENLLKDQIRNDLKVQNNVQINVRQHKKLYNSIEIVKNILEMDSQGFLTEDLLAEEIRAMISNLEEITGTISSDDVLGEIFKRFCIGK